MVILINSFSSVRFVFNKWGYLGGAPHRVPANPVSVVEILSRPGRQAELFEAVKVLLHQP